MFGVEKEIVERALRGCVIGVLFMHLGIFYMYIFSFPLIFLPQPMNQPNKQPTHRQIPQTTSFTNSLLVRFKGYLIFPEVKNQTGNHG